MGLISHEWVKKNTCIQTLGDKISGQRWISSLIRKMWDTAWDIWNYRNHTLHASDVTKKTENFAIFNKRAALHFNKRTTKPLKRCNLPIKTSIHTLLSYPVHKHLSWTQAVSRSYQSSQRNYIVIINLLDSN